MERPTLTEATETPEAVDLEALDAEETRRLERAAVSDEQTAAVDEGLFGYAGRGEDAFLRAWSGKSDVLLEFVDASGIDVGRDVSDSGFVADVFRYLQGFSVAGVEHAHVRLPVLEIHRPFVDGCTTTAKLTEARSRKRNVGITLLGATFSGSCSAEASCTIEHTVTRQCSTISYPARITFKKWVYPGIPAIKPLYTVKDIWIDVNRAAIREGISGAHGCALIGSGETSVGESDPNHIKTLDVMEIDADDGPKLSIEKKYTKGKMVELEVGIKTEAHPDGIGSLGFSLETSVLVEYDLTYSLEPGSIYSFRRRSEKSAVIWCTATAQL
jgi:hypothetical protein